MHVSKGTISRRKDGLYICQVVITDDDNNKTRKSVSAHDRKTARIKLQELHEMGNTKTLVLEKRPWVQSYVDYLLNDWLDEKIKVENCTLRTRYDRQLQIRRYIKPFFKKKIAAEITSLDIIKLYKQLSKTLSAETIHKVHAIINNSMNKLLRDKVIESNPCQFIKLPRVIVHEPKILTREEVIDLLAAARKHDDKKETKTKNMYTLILLAVSTGMRRGELCALQYADIDYKRCTINVQHSIQEINGQLTLKSTKTNKARLITVPPNIIEALRQHRKYATGTYVFPCATDKNKPQAPHSVSLQYRRIAASIKVSKSIHLLRHTHLSILAQNNVDIRTIAQRAGHHNLQTTMRYLHSNLDLDRDASSIFSNI